MRGAANHSDQPEGRAVVQIIDNAVAGPAGAPHLEFYVYRSPGDGETVMGHLASDGLGGGQVAWPPAPAGVPVKDAYLRTLDLARRHGVDKVWVNDPEGLFPAVSRPRERSGH
jgi:hypothetical protein